MPNYERPPVVEALIDIRFEPPLSEGEMRKCVKKIKSDRFTQENVFQGAVNVNLSSDGSNSFTMDKKEDGFRFTSLDFMTIIQIFPGQLVVSALPPYSGWGSFYDILEENWEVIKKVSGYKRIQRIGIRYVNRIDIPVSPIEAESIDISNYLKVGITFPMNLAVKGYDSHLILDLDENNSAIVRTATIPPVLPFTAALLLDLDIYTTNELPANDKDFIERLNIMRDHKNSLFEQFITDKSKKLFNERLG